MTVGQRIKEIRVFKMNMSREDFAKAVGCGYLSVENWEHGRTVPALASVDGILKATNMTYEEFMKGVELKRR